MATSIGPRIGIEGEKEFRDSLLNIIQQCKTLASEVEAVSTSYKKNTDAQTANQNALDALSESIQAQERKISELEEGYAKAAKKLGENHTKTLRWIELLNKAEVQLDETKSRIAEVYTELAKDAVTTASKEVESLKADYDKICSSAENWGNGTYEVEVQQKALTDVIVAQQKKVDALNNLYETAKSEIGENTDNLIEYKTAISNAEKELDNLKKELAEIPKKLAVADFKEAAAQVDNLKAEYEIITNSVGKYQTASEKASAQQANLTNQIRAQMDKVDALERVYQECRTSLGATDSETLKWKTTLSQAEAELDQMDVALSRVNLEMSKSEVDTHSKRVEVLAAEYDKASTAVEKNKSALEQNRNQHDLLSREIQAQEDKIQALIRVYDEAQIALDKNEDELLEWRTEILRAETELDNLQSQLRDLPDQLGVIGSKMQDIGGKISGVGTAMTAGVTAPILAVATSAVNNYGDVDKTFRQVKATIGETNNTTEEFDALWDTMLDEATRSVYDVQDAADALLIYAQAGYDAVDSANLLHGAFALSAGTGTDMSIVTEGLTSAIKGFNDSTENANHYADVFARGQAQAKTTTTDLVEALADGVPMFNALGYDIEDLVAAVGMLGDGNVKGSTAAQALRTGLMRLAAPTENASLMMQTLGLQASDVEEAFSGEEGSIEDCAATMEQFGLGVQTVFDDQGNIRSFSEIISSLQAAFAGLTQKEQLQALNEIFGKNRGAAWLSLIQQGSERFDTLSNNLRTCKGDADDMADALMDGVGGAIEKVKSNWDVVSMNLGESLAPTAQAIADALNGIMDWFVGLDQDTQNAIVQAALWVAAIGPVLLVIGKLITGIGSLLIAVKQIKLAFEGAKAFMAAHAAFAKIATVVGGLALLFVGVATAVANFLEMWKNGFSWLNEILMVIGIALAGVAAVILGAPVMIAAVVAAIVAAVATAVILIKEHWEQIKEFFGNLWENIKELAGAAWDKICEVVTGAWQAIRDTLVPILEPIVTVISDVWNTIVNVITAILEFLWALIESAWMIIYAIIEGVMYKISTFISNVWNDIVAAVSPYLQAISNAVSTVFTAIKKFITDRMNDVHNFIDPKWQAIKTSFFNAVNNIKLKVTSGFLKIKKAIIDPVKDAWEDLTDFLSKAYHWGGDLVNNIADGIRDAAKNVKDAAKGIAQNISDFLHFTEPDVGPLSKMHTWMPDMMQNLASGIMDNRFIVSNAARTVAGDIAGGIQPQATTNTTNMGGITIIVNGAEGQDVNELANIVMNKINNQFTRNRVAFG